MCLAKSKFLHSAALFTITVSLFPFFKFKIQVKVTAKYIVKIKKLSQGASSSFSLQIPERFPPSLLSERRINKRSALQVVNLHPQNTNPKTFIIMKIAMQDVAKKLALWHTPTFRPIITHDDLEPIMASVGFVSLSNEEPAASMQWMEYCFGPLSPTSIPPACFSGDPKPRPRLPFPRIDGLHLLAYKAFLCALEQYISPTEVHNLFHVRAMHLTRLQDRVFEKAYRPMKGCDIDDDGIYVFRDGTIDQCMFEQITAMECSIESDDDFDNRQIKGLRSHSSSTISLVPWDNLLPEREINGPG